MLRATIDVEWVDTDERGWEVRVSGPDGTIESSHGRNTLAEAIDLAGAVLRGQLEHQAEGVVRQAR
jgi:hypothetical protein